MPQTATAPAPQHMQALAQANKVRLARAELKRQVADGELSVADVVLDWAQLGGLDYEARISRLARWVDEAERDGRRYRLRLPGHPDIGPDRGAPHRHACQRALALLPQAWSQHA